MEPAAYCMFNGAPILEFNEENINASWFWRDRLESCKVVEEAESGSTATVVFARSDRLVLAYVGDSRAVSNQSVSYHIEK